MLHRKMNAKAIITIFILLVMFILFGYNTFNVDMKQYESIFQIYQKGYTYSSTDFEIGFKMIFRLCYYLGISYQGFLKFIAFVGLFLIYKTAKKFTQRPYIVLFLFFLFPFFHQVTIIRNFIALAISFYALQYLEKKEPLMYIVLILIASLFHRSALVNLIFLFILLDNKKLNLTIIWSLVILLTVIYLPFLKSLLISLIPKVEIYLLDQTRISTKLILILYYSSILFISRKMLFLNVKEKENTCFVMYKCLKIGIVFLPLTFLSMNFFRLLENMILCFYIIIANSNLKYVRNKEIKISINYIYVLILIVLQCLTFEIYFSFDSVILPILENNILW